MADFFSDNPDMLFHLANPELRRVIEMREGDFTERQTFAEAPQDVDDALDNYKRVLSVLGTVAANDIAPFAAEVDQVGVSLKDGKVSLAEQTEKSLLRLRQAGVMGFTLPRKYGGLNFPKSVYSMAIELVSRADASLMTLFGLQEISETIHKYGSDDQKLKYLPRFCAGELSGGMALTEPDAGSDLPAIKLRAIEDENGEWKLTGVKRFITNGCADILLVAARSEADIEDARGLSLFIYEKEEHLRIRRIENKLGIHGSPTCELQFDEAPAELLGLRKRGLLTYTMSLMNGARLGIAAQTVGIMEAAYQEARSYAGKRIQYGQTIDTFPQVIELLTDMRVDIEASRALLYEASRLVDMKEGFEKKMETHPETKRESKRMLRTYALYEQLFTPLVKYYTTEQGNRICYDAIQIHGGVGFMKEFPVERLYRDMRITSIYEGTSQMQAIAAGGAILRNITSDRLDEYEESHDFSAIPTLFEKLKLFRRQLESAVAAVQDKNDMTFMEFHAVRLVTITINTVVSYLLSIDALRDSRKKRVARLFMAKAQYKISSDLEYILNDGEVIRELHKDVI